jgi:hypothetical protein
MKKVSFLSHVISKERMSVDPRRTRDMLCWNAPASVIDIRSFLGLIGYYRKFVKGFPKITKPMDRMLWKGKKFK